MAPGATFATGGRGCDGHPAQIAHNSWHPGFHPRAECARLEPPPEKFEPSVPSRRCTKVHIKPSIVVACPCPPISRPPRAISVQKTRRAGGHFKGHDETSPAQLAILSHSRSQLACYLCSIEALPSKVSPSLEERIWGGTASPAAIVRSVLFSVRILEPSQSGFQSLFSLDALIKNPKSSFFKTFF